MKNIDVKKRSTIARTLVIAFVVYLTISSVLPIFTVEGDSMDEDIDSDLDGLSDVQESLIGTDTEDGKDPGLYCIYDESYRTRDYDVWKEYSDQNGTLCISSEKVVVRRGSSVEFGGYEGSSISIDPSKKDMTEIMPSEADKWTVNFPAEGTVGKYTITAVEGNWTRSMEVYVVFDPWKSDISSRERRAYAYDEDGERDERGYIYTSSKNVYQGQLFPFGDNGSHPDIYQIALSGIGNVSAPHLAAVKIVRIVAQRNTALPGQPGQYPQFRDVRDILFYEYQSLEGLTLKDAEELAVNGKNIDELAGEGKTKRMNNWCDECAFAVTGLLRSVGIPSRVVSLHPSAETELMGHFISEAWFKRSLYNISWRNQKGGWFAVDADEWNARWDAADPVFWMPMGECYCSRSNYGKVIEHLFRVRYSYHISNYYVLGTEKTDTPEIKDVTTYYKEKDLIELQYGTISKFKGRGGGDLYHLEIDNHSRLKITTSGGTRAKIYLNKKDFPALKISFQGYPPSSPNKNLTGDEIILEPGTYHIGIYAPMEGDNSIEGNYGSYVLSLERADHTEEVEDDGSEDKTFFQENILKYIITAIIMTIWMSSYLIIKYI